MFDSNWVLASEGWWGAWQPSPKVTGSY